MKYSTRSLPASLGLLLTMAGLATPLRSGPATVKPIASCCAAKAESGGLVSELSLFQVQSVWTTDEGKEMRLIDLRGRPQIVVMFYSTCVSACPVLVHDVQRIEAALSESARTNIGVVLISFDSERDTVGQLAAYRARLKLPSRWKLLRGNPDDVLELAALLGVKYKRDPQGNYSHSNIVTLLDPRGEVVLQQVGLNRDPAPMAGAIEHLLDQAPKP